MRGPLEGGKLMAMKLLGLREARGDAGVAADPPTKSRVVVVMAADDAGGGNTTPTATAAA